MAEYFAVVSLAAAPDDVHAWLAAVGGRAIQAYGARALVVELPEGAVVEAAETPGVVTIFDGPVPEELGGLDEVGRMGVAAWNLRKSTAFRRSRQTRVGEGRSWGDEEAGPEG
jgi:hypothetical protein